MSVQGDFRNKGGGHRWKDSRGKVGIVTRVLVVTNAVAVRISETISVTVETVGGVGTGAVIVGGCSVKVARSIVLATRDFIAVTNAVAIGIREAVSVTVKLIRTVEIFWVFTRSIVFSGKLIIVASSCVRAACDRPACAEVERITEFSHPVSIDKDLAINLSADFAVRGELTNEDFEVVPSNSVGISIEGIPCTSNEVINGNAGTGQTSSRIEVGHPGVVRGLHRAHIGFSQRGVGHAFDADCHPAVIDQIWIHAE